MLWFAHLLPLLLLGGVEARYEPKWESLDSRPLPEWYDRAKIGIFINWGVYSVPSFGSEWFWEFWKGMHIPKYIEFMVLNYPPNFTYADFASQFTAEFFDPEHWASVFNASGAQYIVFSSKHAEGFTNWPSKYSWNWNSVDVGPKRDLVGDLAKAVRSKTPHIHFGLYHCMYEWFNPWYIQDVKNNYTTNDFVTRKTLPEVYELVERYHPDIIWSDGVGRAQDSYWNSKEFLAWLFNDSPVKDTVVVNDRWGKDAMCHHGSFYTCEDRYNPGYLLPHKWENCFTLDKHSWGYRRNAPVTDYLSIHDVITSLAQTISCGGNILVNIGPTHEGVLPPIMEERLRQLGVWLGINGEAVYDSKPWAYQNDSITQGVWFTSKDDLVYSIVLAWPKRGVLTLGSVSATPKTRVSMLGYTGDETGHFLQLRRLETGMGVRFPPMADVTSQWAWVLVMSGVNPV